MKKYFVLICAIFVFCVPAYAKVKNKDVLSDFIKASNTELNSISISVKDLNNGKTVYSLNDKILLNPASVQKIITTPVAADVLGDNYKFETKLYSRGNNSYVLQLGADPYLTSDDLEKFARLIPETTERVYIDDKLLDTKNWGEGWQWDDDMNVLMPHFGTYNLDGNLIKITIIPSENGGAPGIINTSKYPFVFYNKLVYDSKTSLNVRRDNTISANAIVLEGTLAEPTTVCIPSNNLQKYFNLQFKRKLEDNKVYLKDTFPKSVVSTNDKRLYTVTHDISDAINDIFKNSNNTVSETLFKLAAKKYSNEGSTEAGIQMFNDYCKKLEIDNSRIKITDASGVSKNNLVSSDFITKFLVANKDNSVYENLASPGEGTLHLRMLPIKGSLKAKTGTLSGVSSIAGFLTSKSSKQYAFCVINNDTVLSDSDKKMLEDFIIREIYLKF